MQSAQLTSCKGEKIKYRFIKYTQTNSRACWKVWRVLGFGILEFCLSSTAAALHTN